MTNDEFQMTKEIRIPNSDGDALAAAVMIRPSRFVLLSTFGFRHFPLPTHTACYEFYE